MIIVFFVLCFLALVFSILADTWNKWFNVLCALCFALASVSLFFL